MFYCMTLYTTIGYGNIVCYTMTGKLTSIFYGLIGIPLTLCVLAQIGQCIEYIIRNICYVVARFVLQ